jgi:hypothetical protein
MSTASSTPGVAPAVSSLAEAGVLGALVVLLGVFAFLAYRREAARADRLEAENGRLRDSIELRVVPLLTRALSIIDGYQRSDTRGRDG